MVRVALPSFEQVLSIPRDLLPKILCPEGEAAFHNVDHMLSVAQNAYTLARNYRLPSKTAYLSFAAGLFHDAGRLAIPDNINIERALQIAEKYAPIRSADWAEFKDMLSATEFTGAKKEELSREGSLPELIVRDADFLVWADVDMQERLFAGLSEETGEKVDLKSTTEFLRKQGVFLIKSQEMLDKAGITGVPLLRSPVDV